MQRRRSRAALPRLAVAVLAGALVLQYASSAPAPAPATEFRAQAAAGVISSTYAPTYDFAVESAEGSERAQDSVAGEASGAEPPVATVAVQVPPRIGAAATAALTAIAFAKAQLGLPYVWGGNGPRFGHGGFDCSGLTQAAFAAAGVSIPRTAHVQYFAGPHVPAGETLEPGDLVFYGSPVNVHHVGLYVGNGLMIHAPTFGQVVHIAPYRWPGDDYLIASRPSLAAGGPGSFVPTPSWAIPANYPGTGYSSGGTGDPTRWGYSSGGTGEPAWGAATAPAPSTAPTASPGATPALSSSPEPVLDPTPTPTPTPDATPAPEVTPTPGTDPTPSPTATLEPTPTTSPTTSPTPPPKPKRPSAPATDEPTPTPTPAPTPPPSTPDLVEAPAAARPAVDPSPP